MQVANVLAFAQAQLPRIVAELSQLVRFASVSAQPNHNHDTDDDMHAPNEKVHLPTLAPTSIWFLHELARTPLTQAVQNAKAKAIA
jgi:hypothetical protein